MKYIKDNWGIILIVMVLALFNIIGIRKQKHCIEINKGLVSLVNKTQKKNVEKILSKQMEFELLSKSTFKAFSEKNSLSIQDSKILVLFNPTGCKSCLLSVLMD